MNEGPLSVRGCGRKVEDALACYRSRGGVSSLFHMKGRDEMGWILLIVLIVLVVACAVSMGLDWTDFLS
jgi:hypothetical protein